MTDQRNQVARSAPWAGEASAQTQPDAFVGGRPVMAERLRQRLHAVLTDVPWPVTIRDCWGGSYTVGGHGEHWTGQPLVVTLHTEAAARDLLRSDALGFLERFVDGEADLEGNLYTLSAIRDHAKPRLTFWQKLRILVQHTAFQSPTRARTNVKSHYDVPQAALDLYLDRRYHAYSCGMFERPEQYDRADLVRVGEGERDTFDSLEKAQWRKFKDAVDYLEAGPDDTLLDVGCGYGGQLIVALEQSQLGKVVGWTHSANQVRVGRNWLEAFDPGRWELHEGDYRQETRVFDHITSTGMISHVGPRGLVPYVRRVRQLIRTGGRYVHHALMTPYTKTPLDFAVGVAFNKRYVWPGFHWFTVGTHVSALERNGFEVQRAVNLSAHYAKTVSAWYERMLDQREQVSELLGDPAFRAWRIYLAGAAGGLRTGRVHVYRLYCVAV